MAWICLLSFCDDEEGDKEEEYLAMCISKLILLFLILTKKNAVQDLLGKTLRPKLLVRADNATRKQAKASETKTASVCVVT